MVYYHNMQYRGKYIKCNVPGNLWEELIMSVYFIYCQGSFKGNLYLLSFKVIVSHCDP